MPSPLAAPSFALSPRALQNYLYARTVVGREFFMPSVLAPLARTLIGKRVGDTVTAQLPAGRRQRGPLPAQKRTTPPK